MSWKSHIEELRARERLAEQMGGDERVARQRSQGKLTVRERIAFLADPGSFHEVGKIAGKAGYGPDEQIAEFLPATMVFGRATLDGRPAVILGDDFTVRGGASDASIAGKMLMAEQMAHEYGMPIVRMVDGTGGGGSVKSLEQNPRTYIPTTPAWEWLVGNMARVPVVSLALGPCAGLGAGRVAASHFSVMVKGLSQIFVAGPPVAKAIGEIVDKEGLGGWEIQGRNGVIDNVVESESEAFAAARRFLSYLPASVDELPPVQPSNDDPRRKEQFLLDIVPKDGRTPYKPRRIVEAVCDIGSFFEIGELWGRPVVTGLARIDGHPVAILAGDPFFLDGAWTADACDKVIRHFDLADTFHLPIIHFVDCPGFAVGAEAREGGRHAPWRARDGGRLPGENADPACGDPQGVWARRLGHVQSDAYALALLLAVGRLGLVADGGWNRGRLQAPARRLGRSRSGTESALQEVRGDALALPHR